jgi:hypothetical protein
MKTKIKGTRIYQFLKLTRYKWIRFLYCNLGSKWHAAMYPDQIEENENIALIRSSGLFNDAFYLKKNPDVAQANIDPLLHYVRHGGAEGRDLAPNFYSSWYLKTNEDVKKSGINPLVHYLRFGREEGRKAQPPNDFSASPDTLLEEKKQYDREAIEQSVLRWQNRPYQTYIGDPIFYFSDMELATLTINVEKARVEGDRALEQKLNNLLTCASTNKQYIRLPDDKVLIDRIGFIIHVPELFNHYKNILKILDKDQFAIVLTDAAQSLIPLLEELQISYLFVDDMDQNGICFKHLVSNHVLAEGRRGKPWIIQELGLKNIRFMYALGKDQWNYSDWNCVYDLVLCFGPHQVNKLTFCENTKKLEIGYPRYDEYFKGKIDKRYWLEKLNCDPAKETIVWLPTKGELSSIKTYSPVIAKLIDQYNIVVKPHPLSITEDEQDIDLLKHQNFNKIIDDFIDNTYLFYVADYIFSDYGGTAFGAIYTDRKLLLLNLPEPEQDELVGVDSADIALRQTIININPEDGEELPVILADTKIWEAQKQTRSHLRDQYFASYYGNAAEITAVILQDLDQILGDKKHELSTPIIP